MWILPPLSWHLWLLLNLLTWTHLLLNLEWNSNVYVYISDGFWNYLNYWKSTFLEFWRFFTGIYEHYFKHFRKFILIKICLWWLTLFFLPLNIIFCIADGTPVNKRYWKQAINSNKWQTFHAFEVNDFQKITC